MTERKNTCPYCCNPDGTLAGPVGSFCAHCEGSGRRAPKLSDHDWADGLIPGKDWVCCRSCGIVKNATSDERPCKGPVRVGPRAPEPEPKWDAWRDGDDG